MSQDKHKIGNDLYSLLVKLFPICRSITGDGVRRTLQVLKDHIPIRIKEEPTGKKVLDWTIPKEWNIRNAFIEDEHGNKIVDFRRNNLHVVGYSIPIDIWLSLSELQSHLYSLEEQPDAIPYVTSYYKEHWGFCISHNERGKLKEGKYHVVIDSELKDGNLTYGEYIIPGKTEQEVFISTYICHPSMANNELSGPVVTTFLAKWLASGPRRYTYRIIFSPETIGSITYLSRNLEELKRKVLVGFNISCVGDERAYSYVASRYNNTFADKVAENVLSFNYPDFKKYTFLERGSDERQYCSPGVDLPLVTLCRSKYGTYPEYHTSLDNLDFVTPEGLRGGYELVKNCIEVIESNRTYKVTCFGEPQLGKRNLYPSLSIKYSGNAVRNMKNLIQYADGTNDLIDISNIIHTPVQDLWSIARSLLDAGVLIDITDEGNMRSN